MSDGAGEEPGRVRAALATAVRSPLRRRWARAGIFLAVLLAALSGLRLVFHLAHGEFFAVLGAGEIARAYLHGLHFDVATAALTVAPWLWLWTLPVPWSDRRRWTVPLRAGAIAAALLVLAIAIAGACYFQTVHRHIGPELFAIGSQLDIVAEYAFDVFLWPSLAGLAAMAGLSVWAWRFLARDDNPTAPPGATRRRWAASLGCALVAALAVRGLDLKTMNVSDAFDGQSLEAGYLSLNGAYVVLHLVYEARVDVRRSYMDDAEAVATVAELLGTRGGASDNPLLMRRPGADAAEGGPRNVLIVVMESWDADYIDAIRVAKGRAPQGDTPRFDALAARGRLYTRFYASGQRSVQGLQAINAGMPSLPHLPIMGYGLEQTRLHYLGEIAKRHALRTFFIRGARHESHRLDVMASVAGIDRYEGTEDYPDGPDDLGENPHPMGKWDRTLMARVLEVIDEDAAPFCGQIFSLSTHGPFRVPAPEWASVPVAEGGRFAGYRNALRYSDHTLGELVDGLEARGLMDETALIVTADHSVSEIQRRDVNNVLRHHHVPLLIVAPGLEPGVDERICSQTDVLPTVVGLMGWPDPHHALGRCVLGPADGGGFAHLVHGRLQFLVEPRGWIGTVDGRAQLYSDGHPAVAEAAHRIRAIDQVVTARFLANAMTDGEPAAMRGCTDAGGEP